MWEKKYKNKQNNNVVFNKLTSCITLYQTYLLFYYKCHIMMRSNHIIKNVGAKI